MTSLVSWLPAQPGSPPNEAEESLRKAMVLPRVVVMGQETAGKSTLLQQITNRQIFPEGPAQTTRFPTKLVLEQGPPSAIEVTWQGTTTIFQNDSEVSAYIRNAIEVLANDNAVSSEEMVIKISGPNLPSFELIDLPGLNYLRHNNAASAMIDSYCEDPNTLVLLVVAATDTALSSNQAVDKVTKLNKRDKTVLCLTMCDNVPAVPLPTDSDFIKQARHDRLHFLIVDRVTMNSMVESGPNNPRTPGKKFSELEVMNNASPTMSPFHSCVAVAHLNNPSDDAEKNYFAGLMENIDPSLAGFDLQSHFTCAAVLKELDKLYHNHMKVHWCPKVTQEIDALIASDTQQLAALGTPPKELTALDVWSHVINKLDKKLIQSSINAMIDAQFDVYSFSDAPPLSLEHIEEVRLLSVATDKVVAALNRDTLAKTMFEHFSKIFTEQADKTMMINRFEYFANKISGKLLTLFNEQYYVKRDAKLMEVAVDNLRACVDTTNVQAIWNRFRSLVKVYYTCTSLDVLDDITSGFDDTTAEPDKLPLLRERVQIANKRKELEAHLKTLNKQRSNIVGFDQFLNTGPV